MCGWIILNSGGRVSLVIPLFGMYCCLSVVLFLALLVVVLVVVVVVETSALAPEVLPGDVGDVGWWWSYK